MPQSASHPASFDFFIFFMFDIYYIPTQEIHVKLVSVCIHHAHPATLDEHAIEVEESSLALDHCIVTGTVFWAMQKKKVRHAIRLKKSRV